jgi:hypothetical protein
MRNNVMIIALDDYVRSNLQRGEFCCFMDGMTCVHAHGNAWFRPLDWREGIDFEFAAAELPVFRSTEGWMRK